MYPVGCEFENSPMQLRLLLIVGWDRLQVWLGRLLLQRPAVGVIGRLAASCELHRFDFF